MNVNKEVQDQIENFLNNGFAGDQVVNKNGVGDNLFSSYVGKYVIVRDRCEGINAGFVVAADETGVILRDARRLRRHMPLSGLWYEGVSLHGLSDDFSQISEPTFKLIVSDNYSITLVSDVAQKSIIGFDSKKDD